MDHSPLMRQYKDIKQGYPDAILFFRVGDFYEMFYEDAEKASKILEIVLTARGKSKGAPIPLCGIPYHAANGYIAKLLKTGQPVALCEQVEDPKSAKGLVRREVVRLYTPGTLFDHELMPAKESNFLASLYWTTLNSPQKAGFGLAILDLSTGEFWVSESRPHQNHNDLIDELIRVEPKELIFAKDIPSEILTLIKQLNISGWAPQDPSWFEPESSQKILTQHFVSKSSENAQLPNVPKGLQAAGALLRYLQTTQPMITHSHLQQPRDRPLDQEMHLDNVTIRNLELIKPFSEGRDGLTLLSVVDKTMTAMGARLLRHWIVRPLLDTQPIQERLDAVAELVQNLKIRLGIRQALRAIQDLERLNSRIAVGVANPRDLLGLQHSLSAFPTIHAFVQSLQAALTTRVVTKWDDLQEVHNLIENTILPEAPLSVRDGGIIKHGYHAELDELRNITREGVKWISELEARERIRTGIDSLKIKFNHIFGYYIEITKTNLPRVPSDFVRKQTLVNAERFTTDELIQLENRVTGADHKVKSLEFTLFNQIRLQISQATQQIQAMAQHIALLDVLAGLAEAATINRYIQPQVDDGGIIAITDGRHPVIERTDLSGGFIANDTLLDLDTNRLLLITGPNMAGKSTYLRQVALIVLMAQIGSFVPAQSAKIGLVDRIFTRVGASDDLTSGQSTFMVEMTETARILDAATSRSLILLDEVGRGTSTYDGLSIAWAVAEFLLDRRQTGARTLFATHYHEMTQLEGQREGLKNYTVLVKEKEQDVLFLRKIVEGKADRSYGIQVAKLAGLPSQVINRAQEILTQLEGDAYTNMNSNPESVNSLELPKPDPSLPHPHVILEEVKQLDLFAMTPLEALNRLADWQRRLET